MALRRFSHSSWSTTSKRATLFRIAGTNSFQIPARGVPVAHVEDGPFVSGVAALFQVEALGFHDEHFVERIAGSRFVVFEREDEVCEDLVSLPALHVIPAPWPVAVPEEQPLLLVQVGGHLVFQVVEVVLGVELEQVEETTAAAEQFSLLCWKGATGNALSIISYS
jgi:hypothetical protein